MMTISIQENIALAPLTTMRSGGLARFFVEVKNVEELKEATSWARIHNTPIFILGAGSNTLVPDEGFPGLVIKIIIKGISYEDRGESVDVVAGAGEYWDDLVRDVVARDLWGIENLSLIPGTVGGAAVQNIGAYGVEVRACIAWVEVFDRHTGEIKTFLNDGCAFGYRESIFKKRDELIVLRVALKLSVIPEPHTEYEDVKKYFSEKGIIAPTLKNIRDAIVTIRTLKMPAPPLGTAGSFFKNPVVSEGQLRDLKQQFPELKAYLQGNSAKVSAAWLLDKVGGFRGMRRGRVGVHEKQSLIIVNYDNASTKEIMTLAQEMKESVKEKTGVILEEEVVMMRVQ